MNIQNIFANNIKRNKIVGISAIVIFILIIVFLTIISLIPETQAKQSANIINLANNCTNGIVQQRVNTVNRELYSYIKAANKYNNKSNASQYTSAIRANSCKTTNTPAKGVYTSTAIVDIPEAKQSWRISFTWSDDTAQGGSSMYGAPGSPGYINDTTVNNFASCLPTSELKYGDFNCEKILIYMSAQQVLAQCKPNGDIPGYINWVGIQTKGVWSFDQGAVLRTTAKLNAIIEPLNAATTHKNTKITCVAIINTNNAQTSNPFVNITTSFQVQFIKPDGSYVTHDINYIVDMNSNVSITLDNQQI